MLKTTDTFFLQAEEPVKSCLLALREIILAFDNNITEGWSYDMPFYYYNEKRFCYLWTHKKFKQPYIGFVDGNKIDITGMVAEKRVRMKIMLFDPGKNIPIKKVRSTLKTILTLYR